MKRRCFIVFNSKSKSKPKSITSELRRKHVIRVNEGDVFRTDRRLITVLKVVEIKQFPHLYCKIEWAHLKYKRWFTPTDWDALFKNKLLIKNGERI